MLDEEKARKLADEFMAGINPANRLPGVPITVHEFVRQRFIPDRVSKMKHAGQLHYGYILNKHVLPGVGNILLRDVGFDHIQDLVNAKLKEGLSGQTVLQGMSGRS